MKFFISLAAVLTTIGVLSFQNCSGKKFESQLESVGIETASTGQPTAMPDCKFGRTGLYEGDTIIAYQTSSVPAGQQCNGETRACHNSRLSGTFQYAFCVPGAPIACLLNGITIRHGETIKTFQSTRVPFGQKCDQVQQIRKCTNGVLDGSYTVTDCGVNLPTNCTLGTDTIVHNDSKKYYQSTEVPFQQNCVWEMRKCTNGTLDGTFNQTSCNPVGPQSCTLDGITIAHGRFAPFFDRSTVAFGQTCPAAVERECSNGSFLGSAVYHFKNCTTTAALGCFFGEDPVAHGGEVEAWDVGLVPYDQDCATKKEIRRCTNGNLSGTFKFKACVRATANACTTVDGVAIESGVSRTLYKSNLVSAPAICDTSANTEAVTCTNGTLSGSARYRYCTVSPVTLLDWVGNPGGSDFTPMGCATGSRSTGLAGGVSGYIERVGLLCSSGGHATPVGGTGGTGFTMQCPAGRYFAGIAGSYSDFVLESLKIYCAAADGTGGLFVGPYGATGLRQFESKCPAGYLVNRLIGRTGSHVDQLQLECARATVNAVVNVDCVGQWQNLGCIDGGIGGRTVMEYNILMPRLGNGLACPNADGDRKQGSGRCFGDIER